MLRATGEGQLCEAGLATAAVFLSVIVGKFGRGASNSAGNLVTQCKLEQACMSKQAYYSSISDIGTAVNEWTVVRRRGRGGPVSVHVSGI